MREPITNALVVGSGSAGRRHARELRNLLPNAKIAIVKRSSSEQPLELIKHYQIDLVPDIQTGLQNGPQIAIVASPSSMHLSDCTEISKFCKFIFLEKPISETLESAYKLHHSLKTAKAVTTVGYHLRNSDTVLELKKILDRDRSIVYSSITMEHRQHLSLWRPGVNPALSVSGRKDLGGGILLEFSHEFDALRFLLHDVSSVVKADLGYSGAPTDGLVETSSQATLKTTLGTEVETNLDMTSMVFKRLWSLKSQHRTISVNLVDGLIYETFPNGAVNNLYAAKPGERDRAETAILQRFLSTYYLGLDPHCTTYDGLATSTVIEAIRQSATSKLSVAIEPHEQKDFP